ncbi:hypothetical protein I7X12_06455 [Halosimplex litoreum]|uniref:Uncharacterized protein n=1 Tax=Halosimplex litoreum TaxID=1198301 RepID=A0A7T3G0R4_9EURY|nr:hypothetical protein [Halosimplex litoreum]QPV64255.1 hypothetical protein I7X12_06455 [Halosimplex litoreum]
MIRDDDRDDPSTGDGVGASGRSGGARRRRFLQAVGSGALVLEYDNGGGFQEQVDRDASDDAIGTSATDVRVDPEAAGVDRASSSLRFNFWQGGASTFAIEERRLE